MIRPFKVIEKYGKNAYKLDLPARYQIHNTFYVGLLEKNPTKGEPSTFLEAENRDGREHVVDAVLDSKVFKQKEVDLDENNPGGLYYFVHWKNKLDLENTWEPAVQVKHLKKMTQKFHAANPDKPRSIWAKQLSKKRKKTE